MTPVQERRIQWVPSQWETAKCQQTRALVARHVASLIAARVREHRVCVQAGGHIGLWPMELSTVFETVYTFEPDAANWACLVQNVTAPNVFPARGALGASPQGVHLERTTPKSGMWFTVPGGPVPTYTIDHLGLTALDALVLDIEGAELPALHGAWASINRFHPLVWFEAHEHGARRGGSTEQIIEWLSHMGYGAPKKGFGRDLYMQVA